MCVCVSVWFYNTQYHRMPAAVQFVQEGWLCSGASRVGCGEDVAQAAQHNGQHYTQPTGQHYTPQHKHTHPTQPTGQHYTILVRQECLQLKGTSVPLQGPL